MLGVTVKTGDNHPRSIPWDRSGSTSKAITSPMHRVERGNPKQHNIDITKYDIIMGGYTKYLLIIVRLEDRIVDGGNREYIS